MNKLQRDLDIAIKLNKFIPFFQPLHDVSTGACVGAEMLARLQLSDGSLSLPRVFFPRVDMLHDMPVLTLTLMEQAGEWLSGITIPSGFMLTINITADMAGEEWLTSACQKLMACARGRIDLVLELTEQMPLTRVYPQWQQQLLNLSNAGVRLALDDFGTGNSGLHLLMLTGAGVLKLPREFVGRLGECVVSDVITDTVVHLAEGLGLELIAEGVETEEQLRLLAARGIRLMQGWHFSPPLSRCDFSNYMSQHY
ncbi:EAL domain-containing protein [Salmonella enterica subsp. enterica]|nr:EAL domain-containing protein [Salmonella enterica subsp. enterica serovar Javiana]EEK7952630.1 EAL domain-containing protein [Salmonella enterica subsp. enterica serovar Javiana]EEK7980285.1 EAL domain-containing protein [Salmonella enterica subsp. enterica serovar Javiana]EEK8041232.1 EAL domain-containing protein [Salmonella enterica subsp. enterica serovar Javiana]EEK8073151.1 EAL domain-containing protein [Salmonella enterica subsp. enterica serovar Javiana]